MKKADSVYLDHILESIGRIRSYTRGMKEGDFMQDGKTQDAVIRQFEIIGEATKRISDEFRDKHTHIPWDEMKGMRNHLIHDYDDIIEDNVWEVITIDIDALIVKIEPLVPPPNDYE